MLKSKLIQTLEKWVKLLNISGQNTKQQVLAEIEELISKLKKGEDNG